ncbi:MAG: hypothetical protein SV201_04940 [Pseudomonadota bacterium]|nr:hypothetical protein [Pseudomonadota bacterium]
MKKNAWLPAVAIILITTGSGCTTLETQYVTQPLHRPERPLLPAVSEEELSCLAQGTARKLTERQRLRREYAEKLETIIDGTHNQGDQDDGQR